MFGVLLGFLHSFLTMTQMVLLMIVVAVLLYAYFQMKKSHSYWKNKGISYVPPKFFLGNLSLIRKKKSFGEMVKDLYDQFPEERYHGIYQFQLPTLIIKDPELIKKITVKEFDSFVDHRTFVDPEADPLFSKNLFASNGEKWRDLRSTLSPSFTSSKMKMMFVLMEECALQFINYLKNQNDDVMELEIKDIFSRYANDVIATAAFGLKCDSLKDKTNEFYLMGKDASNFGGVWKTIKIFLYTISPFMAKLLKLGIISKETTQYFTNIIEDTIKSREEQHIIRPDMIHLMLEARKDRLMNENESTESSKSNRKLEICIEDIVANAFVFFVAGFDTTSTFLTFTFYELAVNPDVQTRLRSEISSVESDKVTYETLLGLKYMDMVVSEALRKWPPVILTDRKATRPFTIQPEKPGEKPLELEQGTICWFPMFGIHRSGRFYPDPEKFDPERFSEENKHNIDPFTYFPFGLGPRNCIGSRFALLEGKLLIFHILKNFEIIPIKRTKIPVVLDKKEINLKPEGGIWLGFKKIHK